MSTSKLDPFARQRSPMNLRFEEAALPLPVRGASSLSLLHPMRAKAGVDAADLRAK